MAGKHHKSCISYFIPHHYNTTSACSHHSALPLQPITFSKQVAIAKPPNFQHHSSAQTPSKSNFCVYIFTSLISHSRKECICMKQGQQIKNLILVLFGCPATLSAENKFTISSHFKFHASQNATMPFTPPLPRSPVDRPPGILIT